MKNQLSCVALGVLFSLYGCGSDSSGADGDGVGGAASGGQESGGSSSGGKAGGGSATGGKSSGSGGKGSNTGGKSGSGGKGSGGTSGSGASGNTGGDGGMGGDGSGGDGTGGDGTGGDGTGGDGTGGDGTGGDGTGGDGTGGDGSGGTVPATIQAAITRQLTPLDMNDPYLIQVTTVGFYPVQLTNPTVEVPEGWVLANVEESSNCPVTQQGKERCRQGWTLYMYPKAGVCSLNKDKIHWSWDTGCAEGGDCSKLSPELEDTFLVTTTHSSEYFCESNVDVGWFLPQSSLLMPTQGEGPVTVRLFTRLEYPYTFTANTVEVPSGFSLVEFTETSKVCDADGCRQWWAAVVDPGEACTASGAYSARWNVGCIGGGNCDPSITTYTGNFTLRDSRSLCDD